jgi:uncharacterized membrane protein
VFFVSMMLGSLLITMASLVYFDPDTLAPFVIEKLPVRFELLWLTSLKVHVASAVVSFPLCLVLMTRWLQRRKSWHRWLGQLTGVCVVGALVPSGIVLSFEAKGGAPVALGFLLSAAIVLLGMVHGVLAALRSDLSGHARAMRHVVAQMSVAVTSRALLIALDSAGMNPDTAYVVALWLPVLASAWVAEWISGRLKFSSLSPIHPSLRSLP